MTAKYWLGAYVAVMVLNFILYARVPRARWWDPHADLAVISVAAWPLTLTCWASLTFFRWFWVSDPGASEKDPEGGPYR